MSEPKSCLNCRWLRVQEPDYEPLCYAIGGEYSMADVLSTGRPPDDVCGKWEAEPNKGGNQI